jgi:hypothetical protein
MPSTRSSKPRAAANKTSPTAAGAENFIAAVADPLRRAEAEAVAALMQAATGEPAVMWGPSIVGFGTYRYRYESGREGTMALVGFSPRKAEFVIYVTAGLERFAALLARLGPHRTGQSCLYLKRVADVDARVLRELVDANVEAMAAQRVPAGG